MFPVCHLASSIQTASLSFDRSILFFQDTGALLSVRTHPSKNFLKFTASQSFTQRPENRKSYNVDWGREARESHHSPSYQIVDIIIARIHAPYSSSTDLPSLSWAPEFLLSCRGRFLSCDHVPFHKDFPTQSLHI